MTERDFKAPLEKEVRRPAVPDVDFGPVELKMLLRLEPPMPLEWKKALDAFIDEGMPWILFIAQDYGGPEIESYLRVQELKIPLGLANRYRAWKKAQDG